MATSVLQIAPKPHQSRCLAEFHQARQRDFRAILIYSATGTGKSWIILQLLKWAHDNQLKAILYTHRRLLFEQLANNLFDSGISYGARAAGHRKALSRDIQIAMVPTERSKVLDSEERQLHKADVVIVDEAHLLATGAALTILRKHLQHQGSTVVGFSATPSDLGHLFEILIQGAGPKEGRQCGLLLPAKCIAPDQPAKNYLKKVPYEQVGGELNRSKTLQWLTQIFGRIISHWEVHNPERLPTICFAPGVEESRWIAQHMYSHGIIAAHIDSKGVWLEGQWYPGDRMRQEVIERTKEGSIQVLSNRFVLREGLDMPSLYYGILATRFGSENSYVQAVGRILRYHDSLPGHVYLQDHGGNCWLWGSPNMDRNWQLNDTKEVREYLRREGLRDGSIPEPYCCPQCFTIRHGIGTCPGCGYDVRVRSRCVLQTNGQLVNVKGRMFVPRPLARRDARQLWRSTYFSHFKKGESFRKAFNSFAYNHNKRFGGYAVPHPDWPFMPRHQLDCLRPVNTVPRQRLYPDTDDWH